MNKPDSLRAALVAIDPELARDPQQLILWIDEGAVQSPMTAAFHFSYAYRLNVLLLGYAKHQAPLMIATLHWLRVNQPDLLTPGKDAIAFEADFLDNASVDLQFTLRLTEQVRAVKRDDGGFDMNFIDEPDPLLADDIGLGEGGTMPPLSDLWFAGERLLPDVPLPG